VLQIFFGNDHELQAFLHEWTDKDRDRFDEPNVKRIVGWAKICKVACQEDQVRWHRIVHP
jgi:hypothetical protein